MASTGVSLYDREAEGDRGMKRNEFRKNGRFTDIILVADGQEFRAHRIILYFVSDYFRSLIDYNETASTTKTPRIEIGKDVITAEGLDAALDFAYTNKLELSQEKFHRVLQTSDFLCYEDLNKYCIAYAEKTLNEENVVQYLIIGVSLSNKSLLESPLIFLATRMSKISKQKAFLDLDIEIMRTILDCRYIILTDKADVPCFGKRFEHKLLKIVNKWVEADPTRACYLEELRNLVVNSLPKVESQEKGSSDPPQNSATSTTEQPSCQEKGPTIKVFTEPHCDAKQMLPGSIGTHADMYEFERTSRANSTYINFPPNKWVIKSMKFYMIPDWDNIRPVAGFDIVYQHIWTGETGLFKCGLEDSTDYEVANMELEENETIKQITIRAGWMINALTFITNKERTLGPFGTDSGGNVIMLGAPKNEKKSLYIHGFTYDMIKSQSKLTFNRLSAYLAQMDDTTRHDNQLLSKFFGDVDEDFDHDGSSGDYDSYYDHDHDPDYDDYDQDYDPDYDHDYNSGDDDYPWLDGDDNVIIM